MNKGDGVGDAKTRYAPCVGIVCPILPVKDGTFIPRSLSDQRSVGLEKHAQRNNIHTVHNIQAACTPNTPTVLSRKPPNRE